MNALGIQEKRFSRMGKQVKLKPKNQKYSALKKRAAFSITAEIYREGTEAHRTLECIFMQRVMAFLLLPGKFTLIIASKTAVSIGLIGKYNLYTMIDISIHASLSARTIIREAAKKRQKSRENLEKFLKRAIQA